MTPETPREWATRTRAEQGLPPHVTDPGVLHHVATLLRAARKAAAARKGRGDDPA